MFLSLEDSSRKLLAPERRGFGLSKLLTFLAMSAALAAGVFWLGPYPITKYPRDTAYMLVQGNYLLDGYRPYVDYNSMHGPFSYLFAAAAMQVHGISLHSIILAQVLGAALFGALMFKMAISRLHAVWAILLAVSVELILISCTPIGGRSWREFTFAMWYNLICYSIYAIVFLYLLAPSASLSRISRWADVAIVGFCLAACLLTKMSFFVPLAAVFVIGAIAIPRDKAMRFQGIIAMVLGAACSIAIMRLLEGSLVGYYEFLGSMRFKALPVYLSFRYIHYTHTIGLFALAMFLVAWLAHDASLIERLKREWILAAAMLGALMLSASTASQDPEVLPLLGVVPLGITSLISIMALERSRPLNFQLAVPAMLAALLLIVHTPKNSAISWVFSHMSVPKLSNEVDRYSDSELNLADLKLAPNVDADFFTMMPESWVDQQFAAISLLNNHAASSTDVIFVATSTSPIALLTDYRNAEGQAAWWPMVFAEQPEDVPLLDPRLLEDADWLLRDMNESYCWQYLTHHRGEYIDDNFALTGENEHWQLYGRTSRSRLSSTTLEANQKTREAALTELPLK